MREIKFRAWDKEDKRIKYFNTYHDTFSFGNKGIARYYNLQNGSGGNEYILMQYTGLKDKNGKEIYEGDILNCECGQGTIIAIIRFGNPNGAYSWGWQLDKIKGDNLNTDILLWVETELEGVECTVIGNIYENPELLKE